MLCSSSLAVQHLEHAHDFLLKVGREHALAHGLLHLVDGPEAAVVDLDGVIVEAGGSGRAVEGVDQLSLHLAVVDVGEKGPWAELREPQLLACFSAQSLFHGFAVVDMAAHGSVPLAGLNELVP